MDIVLALVTLGGLYALVTTGLAVTFAASRIVNLAQGDLVMVGAYVAAVVTATAFGWRVLLALAAAAPVLFLVERLLLRGGPADGLAAMLVTWGVDVNSSSATWRSCCSRRRRGAPRRPSAGP